MNSESYIGSAAENLAQNFLIFCHFRMFNKRCSKLQVLSFYKHGRNKVNSGIYLRIPCVTTLRLTLVIDYFTAPEVCLLIENLKAPSHTGSVVQWVKSPAAKPEDLSLVLPHIREGENGYHQPSSGHRHHDMQAYTDIHTQ